MKVTSFTAIVRALNAARVRFIVVGGLAVNAHGSLRFTNDVDLVIRLTEKEIVSAFKALGKLGYHPAVPVTAESFAEPANRRHWAKTRNMTVLQMWSDQHRETPVDILVNEPFDFAAEYKAALVEKISPRQPVRFASLPALIKLKRKAGRAEDRVDIANLRAILKQQRAGN